MIGDKEVSSIYLGDKRVTKVYKGTELIYSYEPPTLKLTIDSGSDGKFILPIRNGTTNNLSIDWGDGTSQTYTATPTNYDGVSHTYTNANKQYVISISGRSVFDGTINSGNGGMLGFGFLSGSTGYNVAANKEKLLKVEGRLNSLLKKEDLTPIDLSTIDKSYLYSFTFYRCTKLTSIPNNLFEGISGPAASLMFYCTFQECTSLKDIPANLFGGISGNAAFNMFDSTFAGC
ncbi:MAG: hypothetical protein LBS23_01030, partial [Holosporaceae bacterium]|nr:hypothetical protein [Holosporaceae bacterium]